MPRGNQFDDQSAARIARSVRFTEDLIGNRAGGRQPPPQTPLRSAIRAVMLEPLTPGGEAQAEVYYREDGEWKKSDLEQEIVSIDNEDGDTATIDSGDVVVAIPIPGIGYVPLRSVFQETSVVGTAGGVSVFYCSSDDSTDDRPPAHGVAKIIDCTDKIPCALIHENLSIQIDKLQDGDDPATQDYVFLGEKCPLFCRDVFSFNAPPGKPEPPEGSEFCTPPFAANFRLPAWVRTNGEAACGETWGPKPGSWLLHKCGTEGVTNGWRVVNTQKKFVANCDSIGDDNFDEVTIEVDLALLAPVTVMEACL